MIQIDDAGNGAVLGGEVIGALRVETGEYVHAVLPFSAYSHFEVLRTLAAKDAVLELLHRLHPFEGEPIIFCTGDVFKEAKEWLTSHGTPWQEEKITGTLQEMVEDSFFNSLRPYGLPERFRAYHHDYHKFHNMVLGWVCQDLPNRAQFCKPLRLNSGLVSRAKVLQTVAQKDHTCSVCNQIIPAFCSAVLDKTGENPAYFHPSCFPAEVVLCDYQEARVGREIARSFVNKSYSPIRCSACDKPVKFKKKIVQFQGQIFHFACFATLIKEQGLLGTSRPSENFLSSPC